VAEDGDGGCAAGVGIAFYEPFVWVGEFFHEEVAHYWVETFGYGPVFLDSDVDGLLLDFSDLFAACSAFEIFGVVSFVSWHEILM